MAKNVPNPGHTWLQGFFKWIGETLRGAAQNLVGPGAVDVVTPTTFVTSNDVDNALTLANGAWIGQRKRVVHEVDGGSAVLTPANPEHFATITFANPHEWAELEWTGTHWRVVAFSGAVIA
jgi:hypothetical protein